MVDFNNRMLTIPGRIPFSSGEAIPSSMNCSFIGQGRFLIDQGRWQDFSVTYSVQTSGIITSDVIQRLALLPLDKVPEQYLTGTRAPALTITPEPPLADTPPVLSEPPTPEIQSPAETPNSGNEAIAGEEAVELGLCRFVSEAVVRPDEKVTLWSGSYIYAGSPGGSPLATESIAILDILGVEAPETLQLHGKTYTRHPQSEILQTTLNLTLTARRCQPST